MIFPLFTVENQRRIFFNFILEVRMCSLLFNVSYWFLAVLDLTAF